MGHGEDLGRKWGFGMRQACIGRKKRRKKKKKTDEDEEQRMDGGRGWDRVGFGWGETRKRKGGGVWMQVMS